MPNIGQKITSSHEESFPSILDTDHRQGESMATNKKEKSLGGEPHPFGLNGHATVNTIKLTRTNAHTHARTYIHTYTHTHYFSLTRAGAKLVVCQMSRS